MVKWMLLNDLQDEVETITQQSSLGLRRMSAVISIISLMFSNSVVNVFCKLEIGNSVSIIWITCIKISSQFPLEFNRFTSLHQQKLHIFLLKNLMPQCDWWEQQILMLQSQWLGRNAISGHLRRFCLFFLFFFGWFFFSLPEIDPWLNQIGCEPLKWNNEWWRGEMWTPINLPCIEQQGSNIWGNVNVETIRYLS